ncbi:MAG: hypothetical protein RBS72_03625 [Sedimentisphaerales bacterium]|jgi:hypothetical protein|nr:hypothetical protein [Sedimentisphaerales bacterium]HNY80132.1 hypothetical protein [Sedimentisphaerales bacterium]HOC64148.1 hypothetical protein [Sedimentisphaerales bacterium]HOH66618.1 hypothetical protein [Sedimentisphaerales bacterium]HPY50368.1 hypothetical protein [Sedimentisphaerales bacterium]
MADWTINKPLGQCCGTGRAIEPGQEYFGALVETEQGLERRDYSVEYWESEKPGVFCFWRSRLADPDEKKELFVSDEMLMAFFDRLSGETDPEKVSFRFVLALVLMRKRRLKYDATKMDGAREIWSLRVVGEKDLVEVVNPHLDDEQIELLTSQIGQILQADL